jgi:hypothetical protein
MDRNFLPVIAEDGMHDLLSENQLVQIRKKSALSGVELCRLNR